MATVTRENLNTLHDKITVKLAKEDYWPSFEKSLKQYAKTANIPGFRKGMVPAGMIRKMYGQSIFSDEVLRSAGKELESYLQQEKVAIFAQPMVMPQQAPLNLDMSNPGEVDFAFEVGLKPDFEVTPLTNKTKLTRYKVTTGDKTVDEEIDRLQRRFGTSEEHDTVQDKNDIIHLSYELSDAEGNVAEGAEAIEDSELVEKLPAKLQEKVMGKKTGESFVITPAEVAEGEELNQMLQKPLNNPEGADQHYKVTITKVSILKPAELNEGLFAQVFPNDDIKDADAFRQRIREELNKEFERVTRDRLHNEMYEMLVHNTPMQLPVDFLKRWLKEGQEKPKSEAEVEKEFPGFDHQLRWTLISDKLIADNNIEVTHEEVKNDIKGRVMAYFGMGADDDAPWMESYMSKIEKDEKTLNETYRQLLFNKLFQWLETQFAIEEQEVSEEEFFKLPDAHAAHHHHH